MREKKSVVTIMMAVLLGVLPSSLNAFVTANNI